MAGELPRSGGTAVVGYYHVLRAMRGISAYLDILIGVEDEK